MSAAVLRNRSKRKRKRIRLAGQLTDSGRKHGRTPCHSTSKNPLLSKHICNLHFRKTILESHQNSVISKKVLKHLHDLPVVLLFGHKEYDIILARHHVRSISCNLLFEIHSADHLGTECIQGLHMSLVAVDQFYRFTCLADECTEDCAKRTCTIYSCTHRV